MPVSLPLENLPLIIDPLIGDHPALSVWDAVVEVTREDRSVGEEHPAQSVRPSLTVFTLVESALAVQSLQLA